MAAAAERTGSSVAGSAAVYSIVCIRKFSSWFCVIDFTVVLVIGEWEGETVNTNK